MPCFCALLTVFTESSDHVLGTSKFEAGSGGRTILAGQRMLIECMAICFEPGA